jgi:hypothetical protein
MKCLSTPFIKVAIFICAVGMILQPQFSLADTMERDPVTATLRQEFIAAKAPTDDDLSQEKIYRCVAHAASNQEAYEKVYGLKITKFDGFYRVNECTFLPSGEADCDIGAGHVWDSKIQSVGLIGVAKPDDSAEYGIKVIYRFDDMKNIIYEGVLFGKPYSVLAQWMRDGISDHSVSIPRLPVSAYGYCEQ